MRLLLDTHAFIWWDGTPEKLPTHVRAALEDASNTVFLSTASAWEIQIKHQLGKLDLDRPLREIVRGQQRTNAIGVLPVAFRHVLALDTLPMHHRDPFDRMLVAQARVEETRLVSVDEKVRQYPVDVFW